MEDSHGRNFLDPGGVGGTDGGRVPVGDEEEAGEGEDLDVP